MAAQGANANQEAIYLFNTGHNYRAYRTLGCQWQPERERFRFTVWAPNAQAVYLIGDFNQWDEGRDPLTSQPGGVYSGESDTARQGDCYKYLIIDRQGGRHYKADPFAFYSQLRPATASVVWALADYPWQDDEYLRRRARQDWRRRPMAIYELHLGSWQRDADGGLLGYRQQAEALAAYVKKMGFTHVELLPVTEYPFDGSWGYQVTGYFSVTARYGQPEDFMAFVDVMHSHGIGVLLDWVPAHFPRDAHGLRQFDGTALYEHADPLRGEQPQWGTMLFDYDRPEVRSFLISSAMFFLEHYHLDGLRLDAVSAMLYWDFCKGPGQCRLNADGSNINQGAVAFLQEFNQAVAAAYPGVVTMAEESTAYPQVTGAVADGGLGFTFKWDMGFMNDSLRYMALDPLYRKHHHDLLTFSMMYAFSEHFILAFSHDEVVHGKKAMVDKMPGDYWQKFASLRAFYGYIYGHPGKKLLFMGDEFGQFIEWDEKKPLDWFLLDYPAHRELAAYVARLNRFYTGSRALYTIEDSWAGFQWLAADDRDRSVIAFLRRSRPWRGQVRQLVVLCNFTPVVRYGYRLPLPGPGTLTERLNSDSKPYGGSGVSNPSPITAVRDQDGWAAAVTVPPLATVYFSFDEDEETTSAERGE